MAETAEKRRGRPRIHQDPQDRMKAWRQKQEGRRLDGYVSSSASWRLHRLAEVWNCSLSAAVERLALEADERYEEILFPVTEQKGY
ncbi:MAG: hypothetical protein ACD_75C02624G0005 [uncultured bacterium]|nr:MAG: hypothetical protein ACD_75C02624G0005 [uncultured bacterium]